MGAPARSLVLALAFVPVLIGAFAGCEGEDLPPSRGPGSPSALPTIWGLQNGASSGSSKALCDQTIAFITKCGLNLGDSSFCDSASEDCLKCFQSIDCSQLNACFNFCSSVQVSPAGGLGEK